MAKTVFITGASSGIGRATAIYFSKKGWNVAASMRNPGREKKLNKLPNLKVYCLDVTNVGTIKKSISSAISDFGRVDVLVNNAGYGTAGIFEKSTKEQIKNQFDVNVFGVMDVTKEILPHFRKSNGGVIINVSSVAGLVAFPTNTIYNASKFSLEGFSESLQYEVGKFNIKVRLIEPGPVKTDFFTRSIVYFKNNKIKGYDKYEKAISKKNEKGHSNPTNPFEVARVIFESAISDSDRLRYVIGKREKLITFLRRILPGNVYFWLVRKSFERHLRD